MASSSLPKPFTYNVFISFRGEDTRHNFVSHLHSALKNLGVNTYKDDENMKRGEQISDELVKAIEESRFYIIIFSKNYASSSWCLDELVKMMECRKMAEHKAYPVFYGVEPTEVRKQIGDFGEAFAQRRLDKDAGKWIEAMKEAAGLAGFKMDTNGNGDEAKFINQLVEEILQELPSIKFSDVEKFIGMEARVEDVVSSLKIGCNEVHMIGIKGMGGGGKTTLAKAVFDKSSHQFKSKMFVENVREKVSEGSSGLESLQKQVLSYVSKDQNISINDVSHGKLKMKERMCVEEVFLVLDDVDDIKQLEALAEPSWFRQGSIIIITTRDEHVLIKHRVKSIHDINLLSCEEAVCLFSWYAFRTEIPIPGYEELSQQVVHYAAGLPLTIRVLGLDLIGKDELEWKDTIERLKEIPPKEILQQLELSFMGLEADHKIIFLDVACFWKGKGKEEAINALQSCQLHAITGLKVLERKSLITVSTYGNLEMHDSIQEMGWDIVRRDHHEEPERHSRLWIKEEIENILANDLGSETTRGIKLGWSELHSSIIMKSLKKMSKLRFLHLCSDRAFRWNSNAGSCSRRDGKFDEANEYFPNTLQYLYWYNYPFSSLPVKSNNLVGLFLFNCNLMQLWKGGEIKVLRKLRFLELSGTRLKTLDLGITPNLETLSIRFCPSFKKLHVPAKCLKLKSLNISDSKLTTLNLERTADIETVTLNDCSDLVQISFGWSPKLISISIACSKIKTLDLGQTMNLEHLSLKGCDELVRLYMPVECSALKYLYLDNSRLSTLDLSLARNLKKVCLRRCNELVEVRMLVGYPKLRFLTLSLPKLSTLDIAMTPNLEELILEGCIDLELKMPLKCLELKSLNLNRSMLNTLKLQTPSLESLNLQERFHLMLNECPKLQNLIISCSDMITLDLGLAPNLEEVCLTDCYVLVEVRMHVGYPKLKYLTLSGRSKLRTLDIAMIPNLEKLSLKGCKDLQLKMPLECPKLKMLDLSRTMLKTLRLLTPNLESLNLKLCSNLLALHMLDECPKLKDLTISYSKLRTFNLAQTPNLKLLDLQGCCNLVKLRAPVGCLDKITNLYLRGCSRLEPSDFPEKIEDSEVALPKLKLSVES